MHRLHTTWALYKTPAADGLGGCRAEIGARSFALGFCQGPHSYLRSSAYNQLDFAIVLSSWALKFVHWAGHFQPIYPGAHFRVLDQDFGVLGCRVISTTFPAQHAAPCAAVALTARPQPLPQVLPLFSVQDVQECMAAAARVRRAPGSFRQLQACPQAPYRLPLAHGQCLLHVRAWLSRRCS